MWLKVGLARRSKLPFRTVVHRAEKSDDRSWLAMTNIVNKISVSLYGVAHLVCVRSRESILHRIVEGEGWEVLGH